MDKTTTQPDDQTVSAFWFVAGLFFAVVIVLGAAMLIKIDVQRERIHQLEIEVAKGGAQ